MQRFTTRSLTVVPNAYSLSNHGKVAFRNWKWNSTKLNIPRHRRNEQFLGYKSVSEKEAKKSISQLQIKGPTYADHVLISLFHIGVLP